jgi:hypothetical protein
MSVMAAAGVVIDTEHGAGIEPQHLEGWGGNITAPAGSYFERSQLHGVAVHGWTMPELWDAIIEAVEEGFHQCDSGCGACGTPEARRGSGIAELGGR